MKPLRRMLRWLPALTLASCVPVRDEAAMMRSLEAPAFFYAVEHPGSPPVVRAAGHADWEKTRPVSADMHVRIGSVTKLFIGTLVLILHDEGKLDVDDKISRYVPGVPGGDAITLKQLANHTSGLPDAIRSREFQNAIVADPGREWAAAEILAHAFSQPPSSPPGESWAYSNTNTILLAMAAEKAAGRPCGALLEEKIFRPLGMDGTAFPAGGKLPPPHPEGYRHGRKGHPIGYGNVRCLVSGYSASWTNAAGNLCSTIGDLGRAARPLCGGVLLSAESRRLLHEWRETGREGYRYGFCIESWDGFIGHRGDVPGYQAVIACDEKDGRGFAVVANLSNTSGGKGPAGELLEWLRTANP